MMTAKQMMDNIRWNRNLKSDRFIIFYWDNVSKEMIPVRFIKISFEIGNSFSFQVEREDRMTDIPYHRVKRICDKDKIIWERVKK
jgi:uncharacterized protein (UPF0248 family)